ncbi:phasin family protein [Rubrivirga sp.]|uniref:phasin family protein n=1 Tax=Rubrivirga sp. TaxID=1885344 RepID=UPI003B528B40
MAKKKTSGSKSSPKTPSTKVPKSLRTGALPRPVGEVWAAGVGALAQARKTGTDSFDALVALGTTVVDTGTGAARTAADQVEAAASALAGTAKGAATGALDTVADGVEGLVEGALGRLGVPGRDEVLALRRQVDALQARVAEMLDETPARPAASGTPAAPVAEPTVYHVATHERGWAVQRVGSERATAVHPTKKEALADARQTARAHAPSRLVVYKTDGTVGEETDYAAE